MKTVPTLLLLLVIGLGCPAFAAPPDHAPAHGYRAKHEYIYYREREIYYAPDTSQWFWIEGRDWRFGARLPDRYQQFTSDGVRIQLDTDRPYIEHRYVVEHYGKGPKGSRRSKYKNRHKD